VRYLIKVAKALYVLAFTKLAYAVLHRNGAARSGPHLSRSVKIVCRYGLPSGITNGALYNARALESLGYDVQCVDVTKELKNPFARVVCEPGGTFIYHCAAPQFLLLAWPLRRLFRTGKSIAYFAWELADPPHDWPKYDDLWDEIWTPSSFSANSLAKMYTCPIRVVPHVLLDLGTPRVWRKGNEPLSFLTIADPRMSMMRKNTQAVARAFRLAFPDEKDVALTIKLQNGLSTNQIQKLYDEIANDPRIRVLQQTLPRPEVDRLFTDSHVYVSMHRAEGFGLPLLEARLLGLATIATAWSGNMDFMSPDDSVLVPYKLLTMQDEGGAYGKATWAEPDIDACAAAMRRFYEDPAYLAHIARSGWTASQPEKQLAQLEDVLCDA